MKITITGSLYSGKSTVARALGEILMYDLFSVGKLQRKLAVEHDMSITEYNTYISEHHLDFEIDDRTKKLGMQGENFIFDGRMAWNFIPDSFKIYLSVNMEESVNRAMKDDRGKSESYKSREDAREHIKERTDLERKRFRELYGVDIGDTQNYDLVVDTSGMSVEEVIHFTVSKLKEYMNNTKS